MYSLSALARWEGFILLGGFFGIVFWKLLTRSINLKQLLESDVPDPNSSDGSGYSARFSGGRAQLLTFTVTVALYYLMQVIHDPTQFPKLPDALLGVLGGSQATYLTGKAYGLLSYKLRDILKTGG